MNARRRTSRGYIETWVLLNIQFHDGSRHW
jgi:hypothetical protein